MTPPRLTLQDIHLTFGGDPLLTGAALSVSDGDRICLVGRNGSGKSTFLKIAAGQVEPDAGVRFIQPGATLQYLEQEPDLSAYENVGAYARGALVREEDAHMADFYLTELGLFPDMATTNLSGGEARRAALARALAPEPDILLLDEPTNHLDLPAIEWLEGTLQGLRSAIVVISHDRRFLETVSRSVVWIDRGVSRQMDKGFASFEEWRDEVLEQEELDAHKLARKIVAEEHWVRYGVTARRKRNQKRMRDLQALRAERRAHKGPAGSVKLVQSEGKTSGKKVIEAKGLAKSFGDVKIVEDLSVRVMRGDRLGIVGPNGAGKSTLIKMLTGALTPDEGGVELGANIEMVTLDQSRASLKPSWTLADALTNGGGDMVEVGGQPKHVIGYMKDFLFEPGQARTPVEVLSGGERARVMLARALSQPSNLMVLDEPTNDLDLETLDLLEEMIADYEGTVLLVSHDRDFIDRVVTSVLVYEGDGKWVEYAGGYSFMMRQRKEALATSVANERGRGGDGDKGAAKESAAEGAKHSYEGDGGAVKSANQQDKLTYKDKYALETLPGEIAELEGLIAAHQQVLADPQLFNKNPEKFNKVSTELAQAMEDLAAREEKWLELEMRREEIEGG